MAQQSHSGTADKEPLSRQYSTFFVDGLFFGIDVLRVQEVLRFQEMTRVPQAPDVVQGLINLRGQLVTAIDMRRRLGLSPRQEDQPPLNVVVRTDDGAVSLLVDEIGDVLEIEENAYERPPENLPAGTRELIRGIYKMNGHLLLVLNTERTVDIAFGNSAGAVA